jgi:hypothetical protein
VFEQPEGRLEQPPQLPLSLGTGLGPRPPVQTDPAPRRARLLPVAGSRDWAPARPAAWYPTALLRRTYARWQDFGSRGGVGHWSILGQGPAARERPAPAGDGCRCG